MNDENHKSTGDEEYQYPNEEYVTETTPPEEREEQPKQPNFFMRFVQNNKKITIVIVIIIVVLIAFKLMSSHKSTEAVTKPQQTVVAQQQPTVVQPSPEVVSQLNSLKQDEQNSQATVNQLQNRIQDIRDQLNQTTAAQLQLNQSMEALVQQVKHLAQNIQLTQTKPVAKTRKKAVPPPPMVFHLKAIVPGRAWIVSNNGLSESVAVGDAIPQYGTVKVVDTNRGMVLTSSGKVIGYGANDH